MRRIAVAFGMLSLTVPAGAQTLADLARTQQVSPFGAKTVLPSLVACTDRATSAVPAADLHVLAAHAADGHQAVGRGHVVVLSAGTSHGLRIGQQFFTRRVQAPHSRERISAAHPGSIRTTGWLTVVAADERFALARIDYACTAVEVGDYLEPYTEPALPVRIAGEGRPNFADLGRVLFGVDRKELFGAGDVLSIDRGAARGLTAGSRVAFYRDRAGGAPLVEIGAGIVLEVTADSSKVVVERSSDEIVRGDYVAIKATPAP